jgi:hypothetical protein
MACFFMGIIFSIANLFRRVLRGRLQREFHVWRTATLLSSCVLLVRTLPAETCRGTICVAPNSAAPPKVFSPGDEYNPKTLKLRIDKQPSMLWPHTESLKIEGLDLKERHLAVITSDGKSIESFWFRFSDYKSANLCVAFDGYQGVQLQEAKRSP